MFYDKNVIRNRVITNNTLLVSIILYSLILLYQTAKHSRFVQEHIFNFAISYCLLDSWYISKSYFPLKNNYKIDKLRKVHNDNYNLITENTDYSTIITGSSYYFFKWSYISTQPIYKKA